MNQIPPDHLPYWLMPTAERMRPILREKIRIGDLTVDVEKVIYTFPKLSKQDVVDIVHWYEQGLLDTKFILTNN
jgi:hypothetical protein